MPANPGSTLYPSRLERIAAQMERLEKTSNEWDRDLPRETRHADRSNRSERGLKVRSRSLAGQTTNAIGWWEKWVNRVRLEPWGGTFRELAEEMARKSKDPFSGRTRQITVLCAFVPFVCSILGAGIRFMPQMPYLSLWQKITYFIAFPIFLAVAGAFVGFLIGVMLDTLERQVEQKELTRMGSGESGAGSPAESPSTQKMTVWIDVEDLEENQRVAETVSGEDGTPVLLRHTLLKPSHIQMLKDQNIERIKVELVKYPAGGDLVFAG
ncbi:MAG: hypothetical protein KC917_04960 [Candidatus Omnitrophica bacterium]|nr:hypothetical protein [Candidatus Omnitrophota bacterium]